MHAASSPQVFWRSKLELQPPCGTHSSDPLDSLDWDNLLIRLYPFVQYLWLIDVFFCAISVPPKGAKNVIVLVLDVLWSHNPMPSKGCLVIDPKGRVSGHLATSRTLQPYLGSQDQTLTKPLVSQSPFCFTLHMERWICLIPIGSCSRWPSFEKWWKHSLGWSQCDRGTQRPSILSERWCTGLRTLCQRRCGPNQAQRDQEKPPETAGLY